MACFGKGKQKNPHKKNISKSHLSLYLRSDNTSSHGQINLTLAGRSNLQKGQLLEAAAESINTPITAFVWGKGHESETVLNITSSNT